VAAYIRPVTQAPLGSTSRAPQSRRKATAAGTRVGSRGSPQSGSPAQKRPPTRAAGDLHVIRLKLARAEGKLLKGDTGTRREMRIVEQRVARAEHPLRAT